tara:strand:+ start:465 stop:815 length:351 start_codon:yes stop_codon:yes gene_type:complete
MNVRLVLFSEVRIVKAPNKVNKTHKPCKFQVNKKTEKSFFIVINLLSDPAFLTLEKRKRPNLEAHTIIKINTIKCRKLLVSLIKKANKDTVTKVIDPVKSKKCSVDNRYEGIKTIH